MSYTHIIADKRSSFRLSAGPSPQHVRKSSCRPGLAAAAGRTDGP